MLIQKDNGRIYFTSEYVNLYLLELLPKRGSVTEGYLPTDLALDFMTLEEAIGMAVDLMRTLGIEAATDGAVVYTLESGSFAAMQDEIRESDWLGHMGRKRALHYLEPLVKAHEGYCVLLTPTFAGYPYVVWDNRREVCVFITCQGIEYVETGFNLELTGTGDEKPLVPLEEALKTASAGWFNLPEGALCTIEKITLTYRFDAEKRSMTPCWIFDYSSGGTDETESDTFDHWVSIDHLVSVYGVGVDAHSGKVIEQTIY